MSVCIYSVCVYPYLIWVAHLLVSVSIFYVFLLICFLHFLPGFMLFPFFAFLVYATPASEYFINTRFLELR